jgi:tetratricopeptide (TPR) repeat protein
LTFDLVNALGIAFLAGNFLYGSLIPPTRRARSPLQKMNSLLRRNTAALLAGISLVVVAGLLVRNLPAILGFNRQPLSGFGRLMAGSLPPGGGIVLGDDALKLTVLEAALAGGGEGRRWHVVNLEYLPNPEYRAAVERRFPAGWPAMGAGTNLIPGEALRLLDGLAHTNRIFFLQPHNGDVIFERFQPLPVGGIHELKVYPAKQLGGIPLQPEQIAEVEKFWDDAWRDGVADLGRTNTRPSHLESSLKRHLAIAPVPHDQSLELGRWYSAALNDWGVELEQNGRLAGAQQRFEQALMLYTNNVAAKVNLYACSSLLAGKKLNLSGAGLVAEKFRDFKQLVQMIGLCGDFDDPGIRCILGNAWLGQGWPRQAWLEFDHARTLAPEAITPQVAQTQIYSRYRYDAEVFAAVKRLRPFVTNSPAGRALELNLDLLEARSWMSQTNPAQADKILQAMVQAHPDEPEFTEAAFKAYLAFGETKGALQIVDAQLAKDPDNIAALNNRAALLIQEHNSAAAIPALDHALSLTNIPSIRLNRAIAYMQATNPAAAETDYTLLVDTVADQFSVHYGLAEIALGRKDTNSAVRELGLSLENTPPDSTKAREVRAQMDALKH